MRTRACRLEMASITVVPGTSVNIVTSSHDLDNGKLYDLCLDATETQLETIVGNEAVTVQIGATGAKYPVITQVGNMFYGGRLIRCRVYRLAFGNDGMPGKVLHFTCVNTPCCGKYNPGNVAIT